MVLHSVTSTGRPAPGPRTPSGGILLSRSRRPARTAPDGAPQGLTGQHAPVPDALRRWLSGGPGPPLAGPSRPRSPAGYMRGPPEVYARYIRLLAPGYRTDRRRAGPRLARRHRVAARAARRLPARFRRRVRGRRPVGAVGGPGEGGLGGAAWQGRRQGTPGGAGRRLLRAQYPANAAA